MTAAVSELDCHGAAAGIEADFIEIARHLHGNLRREAVEVMVQQPAFEQGRVADIRGRHFHHLKLPLRLLLAGSVSALADHVSNTARVPSYLERAQIGVDPQFAGRRKRAGRLFHPGVALLINARLLRHNGQGDS